MDIKIDVNIRSQIFQDTVDAIAARNRQRMKRIVLTILIIASVLFLIGGGLS